MSSRTTRPITLAGPEAAAFANAQFSSDVLSLAVGHWQWSGWLDPKGRVRALLQIARVDEQRFVVVPRGSDGDALANDLRRFVFRTKVKIDVNEAMHVADGDAYDDMHVHQRDDGTLVFGEGDASTCIGMRDDGDAWIARHIHKGYAWIPDESLNELLPPALSMERLHAVAFDKGCFPGQEIAARLHFLGGHKRHLRVVQSDVPMRTGEPLRIDGKHVGIVLMHDASTSKLTSLVVLDDAVAQSETVENDGNRLHIVSTFDA